MLLTKLVLAHLLGDFLLQPNSWVEAKGRMRIKAWQLYLHTLLHFLLPMLFIWEVAFIKWAFLLALSHFIVDVMKLYLQNSQTKRRWFFIDQIIHLVIIIVIWIFSQGLLFHPSDLFNERSVLLLTLLYALTQPASVMVKLLISRWSPSGAAIGSNSLENAGKYIGMLERLFVFVFVISGNWQAIGFLVAAKSVFRFGDLKESKERKLTEYVLIGTLLSFGIAMLAGIVYFWIINK